MDDKNEQPENGPVNEPASAPAEASGDVQQFSQWMTEYGRPALIGLAVAVVVLLGLSIWRNQKAEKSAAAVQALFQARSPEEFLQMATLSPEAPTSPVALATAGAEFYAQNRYDEALNAYQRFLSSYAGHEMAPDAELGVAASQEALDDFASAADGYEAFVKAHPDSSLMPQAVLGAARCREQMGQFAEARSLYEDFIMAHPDSSWIPQAESGLLFLKKAERAKNAPARPAVSEKTTDAAPVFVSSEEFPEAVVVGEAPAVAEATSEEAGTGEPAAVNAPEAPAVDEGKAVQEEPKTKKNKSSKKKKKAEKPVAESAPAAEPAAE